MAFQIDEKQVKLNEQEEQLRKHGRMFRFDPTDADNSSFLAEKSHLINIMCMDINSLKSQPFTIIMAKRKHFGNGDGVLPH